MRSFYVATTFALLAMGITTNKYLLGYFSPVWFVAIRMLTASAILAFVSRSSWDQAVRGRLRKDFKLIALIAACTTFLPTWLKSFGLKYMPAAKTTLLGSIDPFVTALYAYLLFNERLTWSKAIGICFGWVGFILMASDQTPLESVWQLWGVISWPEIAVLLAIVTSRLGWTLAQQLLKRERYQPVQINTLMTGVSGLCAMSVAYASDQPICSCSPPFPQLLIPLFVTIVGSSVVGYAMYAKCLKLYSPTYVSLMGFTVPILVALFSWLFLAEPITYKLLLSFSALFTGMLIFESEHIISGIRRRAASDAS